MIFRTVASLLAVTTTLAFFGKMEEISQRLARVNHNLLVINGIDPATGQSARPERHQIFEQVAGES